MSKELTREEKLKIIANDLLEFGKAIVPRWFYLSSPEFHKEVADIMMDRSCDQVLIQAPRGFAKSSLSILMILHHIIFDEGDKTIVIQSKTQPEAMARLNTVKKIIEYSTRFRKLFGYGGKDVAETWQEKKIKTKVAGSNVTIKAIGTGMPARGSLEGGVVEGDDGEMDVDISRITLYFLDDPDDEDNTLTVEQMDKNFGKFLANIQGMDKRQGRVLVIGTPVAKGCIVDKVASDPAGWVSKTYSAYWDEDGVRKYLWEEMRDQAWLDNKKEEFKDKGKLSKFYSEYLCVLKKGDDVFFKNYHKYKGNIFFEEDGAFLKVTRIDGIDLDSPRVFPINTFLGIDPASTSKEGSSYSVTFSIAYSANKDWFVLPYFRKRVPPLIHSEQIIESIKNYKYSYGSVETVGYQLFLRDYLRQLMFEEDLHVMGLERKWNPNVSKDERLETMQPMFATGHVYIMEDMEELEDELQMFPDGTKDLLDGMYYATRRALLPDHAVQTEPDINFRPLSKGKNKFPMNKAWMLPN